MFSIKYFLMQPDSSAWSLQQGTWTFYLIKILNGGGLAIKKQNFEVEKLYLDVANILWKI